jgi:hypothetical protein
MIDLLLIYDFSSRCLDYDLYRVTVCLGPYLSYQALLYYFLLLSSQYWVYSTPGTRVVELRNVECDTTATLL